MVSSASNQRSKDRRSSQGKDARRVKNRRKRQPAARRIAFDVLDDYFRRESAAAVSQGEQRNVHVTDLLSDRLLELSPPAAERRLATELVYGIVRRRKTLDCVLQAFLSRPREEVEDSLWTLLRLGGYQLLLLDAIPAHAAVHETVQIAEDLRKPQWKGFLNGVLRSLARAISPNAVDSKSPFAYQHKTGYRTLDRAPFADPNENLARYIAEAFSYPQSLIEDWLSRFGADETERMARWMNLSRHICLRVNPLQATRKQLLEVLKACQIDAQPGRLSEVVHLRRSVPIEDIPGYAEGWFTVQDESSSLAVDLLDPRPGWQVLDLCAAPGGKSTHLAERMQNQGVVLACDVSPTRLQKLTESANRLGLKIIETRIVRADGSDLPSGPFDAVLIDVPCSNTGVLGKRPDARWRFESRDQTELTQLQAELLSRALRVVDPSGRVVYSTCSIQASENEELVRRVVSANPEWSVLAERFHKPGEPVDGGYQALLGKSAV